MGKEPVFLLVTPEMAQYWLENHNPHNRPINSAHVKELADCMRRGAWMQSSDGISFDCNGMLTNGQHRLSAIVQSGIAQEMLIVYGIDANPFTDRVSLRKVSDNLAIADPDNKYSGAVVASINLLWKILTGKHVSPTPDIVQSAYNYLRPHMEETSAISPRSQRTIDYGAAYYAFILAALSDEHLNNEDILQAHETLMSGMFSSDSLRDQRLMRPLRDNAMKKVKEFKRAANCTPIDMSVGYTKYLMPYLLGQTKVWRNDRALEYLKKQSELIFNNAQELQTNNEDSIFEGVNPASSDSSIEERVTSTEEGPVARDVDKPDYEKMPLEVLGNYMSVRLWNALTRHNIMTVGDFTKQYKQGTLAKIRGVGQTTLGEAEQFMQLIDGGLLSEAFNI